MPDLRAAEAYYDRLVPLLGFEEFLAAEDQFAYRVCPEYPQPYYASFWLDPAGFVPEAVCHHDRG
ncbi:hypothetical protein [Amycolatopsis sp. cmx-4-68]|uniref:hypothetical protein n=1 Tax=Amycolatopsis sp. cmx-4-68 TaxID=2790938 RepID=UPI003978A450